MREVIKRKIPYYLTAVILVFAYVLIMLRGSVYSGNDDAYYNYYISKRLAYYSRPDELKNYREGTLLVYNTAGNYRNQGEGWSAVEDDGTWCIGNESDFYLYVDEPDKPYELVINVKQPTGYKNYITANGVYQGDIVWGDDNSAIVPVNSGLHEGLNRFSICTDDVIQNVNENRMYGDYDGRFNMYVESMILKRKV